MNKLMNNMKSFMQEEDGVTAIEYGLIAALIALAIIVGAGLLGTSLNELFTAIAGILDGAVPAGG